MKQKDIAMVIIVAAISVVVATVVSNAIFASSGGKNQQAETIDAISWEFVPADAKYFNKDSINPTEIIRIGDSTNQTPFDNQAQ